MKSVLQVLVLGVIGSVIGSFLYENGLPIFGAIVAEYPFQSFVVFTLTVIMIFLAVLTVRFKGH